MSLRTDVHATFEAIAPSTGGMAERIVETVRREARTHKGTNRMSLRVRVPLALVAAFLLVALVVAVFVGVRVFHSSILTPAPAGQQTLTAVEQLEARSFRMPSFTTAKDCVPGPYTAAGDWGGGPLYGYGGSATTSHWGEYFYLVLYTDKSIGGPILVRIRDITGKTAAMVGAFAGGAAIGTDVVDGTSVTQFTELVIDEGHTTAGGSRAGWPVDHHRFVWDFMAGQSTSSSLTHVLVWQIDGTGFSETFVVC